MFIPRITVQDSKNGRTKKKHGVKRFTSCMNVLLSKEVQEKPNGQFLRAINWMKEGTQIDKKMGFLVWNLYGKTISYKSSTDIQFGF